MKENAAFVEKAKIMDETQMGRTVMRLAHQITEKNRGVGNVVLVGIIRRGLPIAERIRDCLKMIEGCDVPVGSIDISFYRDDLTHIQPQPVLGASDFPVDINEKDVVLVDDVIYTGRTVRAAIDGLFRGGRPRTVQLCVMVDRGLRELPIEPDFVGKNIGTSRSELISVRVKEIDGEDSISIYGKKPEE